MISTSWDENHAITNTGAELTHVHLNQVTGSTAAPCVDLEEVPVSPSLYPTASIDVTVYENGVGGEWAIGRDASNNLWTFFKKPKRFGDYWIASEVIASQKNENERINEKLKKGYQPSNRVNGYRFCPNVKSLVIR